MAQAKHLAESDAERTSQHQTLGTSQNTWHRACAPRRLNHMTGSRSLPRSARAQIKLPYSSRSLPRSGACQGQTRIAGPVPIQDGRRQPCLMPVTSWSRYQVALWYTPGLTSVSISKTQNLTGLKCFSKHRHSPLTLADCILHLPDCIFRLAGGGCDDGVEAVFVHMFQLE